MRKVNKGRLHVWSRGLDPWTEPLLLIHAVWVTKNIFILKISSFQISFAEIRRFMKSFAPFLSCGQTLRKSAWPQYKNCRVKAPATIFNLLASLRVSSSIFDAIIVHISIWFPRELPDFGNGDALNSVGHKATWSIKLKSTTGTRPWFCHTPKHFDMIEFAMVFRPFGRPPWAVLLSKIKCFTNNNVSDCAKTGAC